MQRARRSEQPGLDRAADLSAARSTPLVVVAEDDLERVAGAAAALERPVVIVSAGASAPVVSPPGALGPVEVQAVLDSSLSTLMSAARGDEASKGALLHD